MKLKKWIRRGNCLFKEVDKFESGYVLLRSASRNMKREDIESCLC